MFAVEIGKAILGTALVVGPRINVVGIRNVMSGRSGGTYKVRSLGEDPCEIWVSSGVMKMAQVVVCSWDKCW